MNQHGGPAELIESFKSEAVGSAGAVLSESAASLRAHTVTVTVSDRDVRPRRPSHNTIRLGSGYDPIVRLV